MDEDGTPAWHPFEDGASIGQAGSEGGVIVRDDEHPWGARITLERDGGFAPFALTCGIYGWMVHTRWFQPPKSNSASSPPCATP